MNQLAARRTTLDNWLMANGMTQQAFMADLQMQASDIARESLALDALVRHMGFEATEEDIDEEFKKAGVADWEAAKAEFLSEGRMPAIRVSIRRNKAIDWLLESAVVTISDEPEPAAEAEEKPAEEAPKKKTTRKSTKKAAAEPAAEAEEKPAEEAPKKKTTRKSTKKAAAEPAAEGEEKPAEEAPKKKTTRKSTKKADSKEEAEQAE